MESNVMQTKDIPFAVRYHAVEAALRKEYDEQVASGELTQEEADFRYYVERDEILDAMPE